MNDSTVTVQLQTMTEAEWRQLGERLFGADPSRWRFKCPTCSLVMSIEQARSMPDDAKARLRTGWAPEQECVGRYLPGQGCDWCSYGLFSGPFFVVRGSGNKTPVFGFDLATPLLQQAASPSEIAGSGGGVRSLAGEVDEAPSAENESAAADPREPVRARPVANVATATSTRKD